MQSALFVLKCLSEGKNEEYLIQRFDNDEQLVRIWMNLLTELRLLVVNVVGEYVITNKGKDYLQNIILIGNVIKGKKLVFRLCT